jgi:hypothetical protein
MLPWQEQEEAEENMTVCRLKAEEGRFHIE